MSSVYPRSCTLCLPCFHLSTVRVVVMRSYGSIVGLVPISSVVLVPSYRRQGTSIRRLACFVCQIVSLVRGYLYFQIVSFSLPVASSSPISYSNRHSCYCRPVV